MGKYNVFGYRNPLKQKIKHIEIDIKEIVSTFCIEKFSVLYYGSYEIDPKNLVFWVCIETDKMKTHLENNKDLNNKLRNSLVKNEYPSEAINNVYIGFESQETVDRESKGDWYLHFK